MFTEMRRQWQIVYFFITISSLVILCLNILFISSETVASTKLKRSTLYSNRFIGSSVTLTLFTSFTKKEERCRIENNTIENWEQIPKTNRINYYCEPELLEDECGLYLLKKNASKCNITQCRENFPNLNHKWKEIEIRNCSSGLPKVKDMFAEAQQSHNTSHYGYANGDILFSKNLIHSIEAIETYHKDKFDDDYGYIIVGERSNINIDHVSHVKTNNGIYKMKYFSKKGTQDSIDFFITPRKKFPWNNILEVVVGKPGWDNYILAFSRRNNIIVYNISKTVVALHQSYKGKRNNWRRNDRQDFNLNLIRNDTIMPILYIAGTLDSIDYYTHFSTRFEIGVARKKDILNHLIVQKSLTTEVVLI